MPFRTGELPIRYLGVPLVSKGLRIKDCKVLIDIVEKRIGDWRTKCLSFAGRLQLIASILFSLQVYWALMCFESFKFIKLILPIPYYSKHTGKSITLIYSKEFW